MEVFVRYNKYWQEGMEMEDSNMSQKMELYYDRPASVWEETIPIGNGRMGGMIWGYRGRRFRGRVYAAETDGKIMGCLLFISS